MKNPIDGGQIKRELSPEEKRIAESFKTIPFMMEIDRADLILTWRQFKSATILLLKINNIKSDLPRVKKVIKDAGMLFNEGGLVEPGGYDSPFWACFIGNNQEDFEMIPKIWLDHKSGDLNATSEMGRMSGYPPTAVDAFINWQIAIEEGNGDQAKAMYLLTKYERENLIPQDLSRFALFQLSREDWKKELETVRKWAEEIKLVDPEFYERIKRGDPMDR